MLGAECSITVLEVTARICTCEWYETCGGGGDNSFELFGAVLYSYKKCGTPWYYYAGAVVLVGGLAFWGFKKSQAKTAPGV